MLLSTCTDSDYWKKKIDSIQVGEGCVVLCHNHLRDAFVEFCHHAHLSVKVEGGSGLTPDMSHLPAS